MSFRTARSLLLTLILGAGNCLAISNSPPSFSRFTVEDGLSRPGGMESSTVLSIGESANGEGAAFALSSLPPWGATWWFRGLAGAALVVAGLAFLRIRGRGAKQRAAELGAEIHKRDLLNRELQISEQRFKNLITNTTEQIWCIEFDDPLSLDLPGMDQVDAILDLARFAEANEALAAAYGATPDEIIGEKFSMVMPRTLPTTVPLLLDVVRSKYNMRDFESVEQAVDGSERIMINNLMGTVEDGKVLRVWGTARDITDQKDAEKTVKVHRGGVMSKVGATSLAELVRFSERLRTAGK